MFPLGHVHPIYLSRRDTTFFLSYIAQPEALPGSAQFSRHTVFSCSPICIFGYLCILHKNDPKFPIPVFPHILCCISAIVTNTLFLLFCIFMLIYEFSALCGTVSRKLHLLKNSTAGNSRSAVLFTFYSSAKSSAQSDPFAAAWTDAHSCPRPGSAVRPPHKRSPSWR